MSDLLSRRMLALQLDQDEIARLDPITFGELQWLCVLCEDRDRCEAGLADDFADVAWRAYCLRGIVSPSSKIFSSVG